MSTVTTSTRLIRLATIAMLALAWSTASADVITLFTENFEMPAGSANPSTFQAAGWQGVLSSGTSVSTNTSMGGVFRVNDMQGNWRTLIGGGAAGGNSYWLWTSKPDFQVASSYSQISVAVMQRDSGFGTGDGYRLAIKMDDTWYLQDSRINGNSVLTTTTVDLRTLAFNPWAAPANDSTAWSQPTTGGGSSLPASGHVTDFGVMVIRGSNDDGRLDNIVITAVPEPSTGLLVFIGGLTLMRRRIKQLLLSKSGPSLVRSPWRVSALALPAGLPP